MKLFALIATLLSIEAQANFSGHWDGEGIAWDGHGWHDVCDPMTFDFDHTAGKLEVLGGFADCYSATVTWNPLTIEIRDGEAFYEGERIGTVSKTAIDIKTVRQEQGYTYTREIHAVLYENGNMHYEQDWSWGGEDTRHIEGDYVRVE